MALLPLYISILLLIQNIVGKWNVLSAPWTRLQNTHKITPFLKENIGSVLIFINGYSGLIYASVSSGPLQYYSLFRRHCSICSLSPSRPIPHLLSLSSLSFPLNPPSPLPTHLSPSRSLFPSHFSLSYILPLFTFLCLFMSPLSSLSPLYLTPLPYSLSIILFPFHPLPLLLPLPFSLSIILSTSLSVFSSVSPSPASSLPLSLVLSIFAEPEKT